MKISSVFPALALAVAAPAYGAEMPWFTIARTDGSAVTVASANLELTFSDGRMFAYNGTERHDFNLSELKFMAFSAKSTEVQAITDAPSPVSVFTPAGSAVGDYSSASEAMRSLGSGVYIMKCGGTVNKVIVP